MPSTYVSLYYHIVFSTKLRLARIRGPWQERLYSYLGGVLRGLKAVSEGTGGTEDHVHILASLRAAHCLAEVVRDLKSSSSKWVHEVIGDPYFGWQDGYGAFTVGKSQVEDVKEYIRSQKEHHRKRTFQEEFLDLLRENGIEYDKRFLW